MGMDKDAKGMSMDGKGKGMGMDKDAKGMSMDGKGTGMGKDAKGMGMDGKGMGMGKDAKGMSMDGKGMGMGKDAMGMGMDGKGMGMGKDAMGMDGKSMAMGKDAKGMMTMMGMMHGDKGEMDMRKMGDTMLPKSSLPGFPGVSHIYHVGATGFFLDHAEHLQLSDEQKVKLTAVQAKSQKQQDELQAKVEEAEKEVWTLTSSDSPKAGEIAAKIKASEALQTDKRIKFIGAVGEAASILTAEQRQQLLSPNPSGNQ